LIRKAINSHGHQDSPSRNVGTAERYFIPLGAFSYHWGVGGGEKNDRWRVVKQKEGWYGGETGNLNMRLGVGE